MKLRKGGVGSERHIEKRMSGPEAERKGRGGMRKRAEVPHLVVYPSLVVESLKQQYT